jgi:hypothetical protein
MNNNLELPISTATQQGMVLMRPQLCHRTVRAPGRKGITHNPTAQLCEDLGGPVRSMLPRLLFPKETIGPD